MAIWNRIWVDKRTYFNLEPALIQKQDSELTIRVLGIPILKRTIEFEADVLEKGKGKLGFNNQ